MSRNATNQMSNNIARRRSEDSVETHRRNAMRHAHTVKNLDDANEQRRSEYEQFRESYKRFLDANAAQRMGYRTQFAVLPAAVVFDFLLFGGTSVYLVEMSFGSGVSALLILLARFLVSLGVVVFDMFFVRLIHSESASQISRGLRIALSVLWIFAITAFTVVTHTALINSAGAVDESTALKIQLSLIVQILFSFIMHTAIIVGGQLIDNGLTYIEVKHDDKKKMRDINRTDDTREREAQLALDAANDYDSELNRHNREFPEHPLKVAGFDGVTIKLVKELSGYEQSGIANAPPRQSSNGDNGAASSSTPRPEPAPSAARSTSTRETVASSPVNTNGNGASPSGDDLRGVLEYQNTLLDRQRRNSDGGLGGDE